METELDQAARQVGQMDMKGLAKYAMNGQGGMAMKGAVKLASMLQGCTSNPMKPEKTGGMLFRKGDMACLMTGSDEQMVTLMEDVDDSMSTARAMMPDGKLRQVDVRFLSEMGNCMDEDTGKSSDISIIIKGGSRDND